MLPDRGLKGEEGLRDRGLGNIQKRVERFIRQLVVFIFFVEREPINLPRRRGLAC